MGELPFHRNKQLVIRGNLIILPENRLFDLLPGHLPMYLATDSYHLPVHAFTSGRPRVETLNEQGSGPFNEDVVLSCGNLYGVFDGATSLERETFTEHGLSGGLLAASIAARTFEEYSGSLVDRADQANQRIAMAQHACGISGNERHRLWSTSLAVLRLGEESFEYCQTGDAMILVLYGNGGHRLVTPEVDIDGDTLTQWHERAEAGATDIYQSLAEQIRRVRLEMNVTYGVLNGEGHALDFLQYGRDSLAGVSDILIFTDGLCLPRRSPRDASAWGELAAIYRCCGLSGLRDHVRRLQQDDPQCRIFPRFKKHDDIAAVAITLQPVRQPAMALA
jgi:hypothetical protein